MNLGPTELIIVLLIVMVLFGAARLPKLARSLGESAKEFKHAQAVIGSAADDPIEKKHLQDPGAIHTAPLAD